MNKLEIPERFTGTVYVCMFSDPNSCLYGETFLSKYDPKGSGDSITLGKEDVDIALDHTGSLDKQVEQLKASKRKVIDEASAKAGQIDEAIESLLAIEHKEVGL
jgi:hypothetical protein